MATCSEHSGVCVNVNNMKNDIDELKGKLEHQRGYFEGQLTKTNTDVKELGDKLRDEIKTVVDDIKKIISEKETKSDNKKWIIISSLISPTIVGLILLVVTKLWN